MDARAERSRAVKAGAEAETAPLPPTRAEYQRTQHALHVAKGVIQRLTVELREARAACHAVDLARADVTVSLDRLHGRYADSLDRLLAANARIAALEAQNANLRTRAGRGGAHG
ncbi:hypothetical protein [Methylobacterium phyllosphaerae]|uniref:hypothetical protein n=1 Tax=Methylobacterium phyllosphaerae TaxID=418223 RepID=UPI00094C3D23|nr:hypothetical protein [Methylobacterium phyllosphaerae]